MKRLCVFYYKAHEWLGCNVEWIVCKECQKKLRCGILCYRMIRPKNNRTIAKFCSLLRRHFGGIKNAFGFSRNFFEGECDERGPECSQILFSTKQLREIVQTGSLPLAVRRW